MTFTIDEMIFVNQVAQDIHELREAEIWFTNHTLGMRRNILEYIIMMAYQARFNTDDIEAAIQSSCLRRTMTPCVLIQKTPIKLYLRKIVDLPSDELWKAFVLLLELYRHSDRRRRQGKSVNALSIGGTVIWVMRRWWMRFGGSVIKTEHRDY